ncbi:hypothetical protein JZ751_007919, partial [Albula glossodonta]
MTVFCLFPVSDTAMAQERPLPSEAGGELTLPRGRLPRGASLKNGNIAATSPTPTPAHAPVPVCARGRDRVCVRAFRVRPSAAAPLLSSSPDHFFTFGG